ncbi:MAG: NAD(P)-binding domain-containing protein [Bacteroidales bacterium]|nr:NAD(P)-binding domain-containing protein [Bacteroidales bacterium]
MEVIIEEILTYALVITLCLFVVFIYLRRQKSISRKTEEKIKLAKEEGLFEPISLHPVVDPGSCIKTGACIAACPEKDILGIVNGKATTINASRCVGHGACFHACPTEAITLCIGTEKRGVDLPHVNENFETNIPGIFIAGELGGMGLIKNAVEQGRQAVENIVKKIKEKHGADYDLIIVGAGPAGISASLTAKKHNLNFITLEQDSLGGTVFTFPRSKIVMTSPMNLPLHGKVKLYETSKPQLLELWLEVLKKNGITIREHQKVDAIIPVNHHFQLKTLDGTTYTSKCVLLAIGRRGTPRKLNIPGEQSIKVAYRLLEPEIITGKNILVVGGGDSAIESALLLANQNNVLLSYRGETFSRIKAKNKIKIEEAIGLGKIDIKFSSTVSAIEEATITLKVEENGESLKIKNDLVFIFAGGELPTEFLKKAGIEITSKYGESILKH